MTTEVKETESQIPGLIVVAVVGFIAYLIFSPSTPETPSEIRTQIYKLSDSDYKEKIELYQKLRKLKPEDESIDESIKELERESLIKRQFSGWDGSHIKLAIAVKKRLRDPSSYEHISTKYVDKGTHLIIITSYRATNGFGGKTIGSTTAEVGMDGEVIKIIQ
jgi:hypothetical protein